MYTKSILRSLVLDGGIPITDPARLRDLLHEQAQGSKNIQTIGTFGGGVAVAIGLLMTSLNPAALLASITGGYAIYLGQQNKATTAEEREFRFLGRHGRILNLLGEFAQTATPDEILSAYESLTLAYLPITDQIVVDGQAIAAGEMLAQLPQVVAAQRQQLNASTPDSALPAPAQKFTLPPSRLHEQSGVTMPELAPALTAIGGESTVAVLERVVTQPAPIGLPEALRSVTVTKPYSTFIIGMSGAGKDIALNNIMAALKQANPTAMCVGIDGKNHAGELPLWPDALYDRKLHISMLDKPQDYHPKLLALIQQACEFPGMVFVAFSELNGIAGSYIASGMKPEWGEISHYLRYLALQGNAAGKFLLSTAQGITLDELGITTATRANIQFLMVGNGSQFSFISSITANTSVFDRKLINDQNTFIAACSRSTALEHLPNRDTDKGIAYFHTALNRWEPMPRLVNPGSDRSATVTAVTPPAQPIGFAAPKPAVTADPHGEEIDLAASIEVEELVDSALEKLYDNPGKEFGLTKLFAKRSQRERYGAFLVDILKDAKNIQYRLETRTQMQCHFFSATIVA